MYLLYRNFTFFSQIHVKEDVLSITGYTRSQCDFLGGKALKM